MPGAEGVAYIAEGKKVYTANWGENKIGVVDLRRMTVVRRIPTEDKPDGIAYAAPFHKAYSACHLLPPCQSRRRLEHSSPTATETCGRFGIRWRSTSTGYSGGEQSQPIYPFKSPANSI